MQIKFNEKDYSSLLEEIYKISPSVQSAGFAPDAYKPGLEGMLAFDRKLGRPWRNYRCIHVAGTNGKGSVASMLASALASNLKVGLYTSPHLVDFRERMKVVTDEGWYMPGKDEVWDFFHTYDTKGLSFFEMTTGLAFWWFAVQKVDVAVIEAGLGGLLDSTNIITPELCIVTSIGLDHCALLGNTRAEIAAQKAGIFKPGVPAIVAAQDPETAPVFIDASIRTGDPLIFADGEDSGADEAAILSAMDLQGPCQAMNLHTALVALKSLGTAPAPGAIENTAKRTGLRGRWEKLSDNPEVICDIGHNPPALEINFRRLAESARPLTIVYGIMADKDLEGISVLFPPGARYILVSPKTPRALPVGELHSRFAAERPDLEAVEAGSVAEGIDAALAGAVPESLIYIGGSTFVVTEAVDYFNGRQK